MATERANLIIDSMNLMGYDALGIGDDDLALGKEFLLEMSKKATFPFLSSNIIDETTGKPLFRTHLIKETGGLRIGIFSLLAVEAFQNPYDPRRKGLILRSPTETAQAMVKDLQEKADMIILLSHLGYPKDVEIAQTVPGINLIVGGHSGINLPNPPVINRSLILQMAPKGLYGGRLDLTFHSHEPHFFNASEKRSFERNLSQLKERVAFSDVTEIETWLQYNVGIYSRLLNLARLYQIRLPEEFLQTLRDLIASLKAQDHEKQKVLRTKVKEDAEQTLKQLQGRNEFIHNLIALGEQIKDHPEIARMMEMFRSKYPEPEKPALPKQAPPRPKSGAPKK
jgi:DNA polymerase III delta prime subunit